MSTEFDDKLYLAISSEMNLSETAFMMKKTPGVYQLRWFTPLREVPLCGHATHAAAHLLYNHIEVKEQRLRFDTNAGALYAENTVDGILMDFPSNPPKPVEPIKEITDALGVKKWVDIQYSPGNQKLIVISIPLRL
jgi:PhzF family phenazine biosynthesis protein